MVRSLILVLATAWATIGFSPDATAQLTAPSDVDKSIASAITQMLDDMHMTTHALDDEISQRFFKNYLEALDPGKMYFLAPDVEEFAKQKTKLDDLVKKGDIQFAFDVFERFLQRLDERVAKAEVLLNGEHDFTVDESVVIDREDAGFAQTSSELDEIWRKRLKYLILDKEAGGETHEEAVSQLLKRYRNFDKRMKQTSNDELLEIYLTSLSTSYDPHTTYMSAGTLENFEISMKLELEGIGAQLQSIDGYTVVSKIIPGGAADRDGRLKEKDKIVAVAQWADGQYTEYEDLVDMKLSDVVKRIRGKKGTKVRLKIQRVGAKGFLEFDLVRAKVELADAEAHGEVFECGSKEGGDAYKIGVIELPSFYMDMSGARRGSRDFKSTTRDVAKLLVGFEEANVDAVVIDLRENGGGSLTEAINMTGLFIDGPVVQVKDSKGRVSAYDDEIPGMRWDGPLVVLTSKFSASASEIFAGAIQDYGRGLIVGDHSTHGKGTVQTLEDVGRQISWMDPKNYGALKITRQQFYRPNGASTQNRGVVADIELPSLSGLSDIGEASLDYALPFDKVGAAKYTPLGWVTPKLIQSLTELSEARRRESKDFKELAKDIERILAYRERKEVPLERSKFMAQYNEFNEKAEDAEKAEDSKDDDENGIERTFYLDEALAITADLVRLKNLAMD